MAEKLGCKCYQRKYITWCRNTCRFNMIVQFMTWFIEMIVFFEPKSSGFCDDQDMQRFMKVMVLQSFAWTICLVVKFWGRRQIQIYFITAWMHLSLCNKLCNFQKSKYYLEMKRNVNSQSTAVAGYILLNRFLRRKTHKSISWP